MGDEPKPLSKRFPLLVLMTRAENAFGPLPVTVLASRTDRARIAKGLRIARAWPVARRLHELLPAATGPASARFVPMPGQTHDRQGCACWFGMLGNQSETPLAGRPVSREGARATTTSFARSLHQLTANRSSAIDKRRLRRSRVDPNAECPFYAIGNVDAGPKRRGVRLLYSACQARSARR